MGGLAGLLGFDAADRVVNSPAVQHGDAGNGAPNQVGRNAHGECGFDVLEPNPAPDSLLTPISVRA